MNVVVQRYNSLRCDYCETSWPYADDYEVCPSCREPTSTSLQPGLPPEAARLAATHARFGWWLWEQARL